MDIDHIDHEVIVVGGGAAGLSAGIALARSRRSVLVIDAGEPRNAPAEGVHNFLSRDGIGPLELVAAGRLELAHYGGGLLPGRVLSAQPVEDGFAVVLEDGARLTARRLVVTAGVVDALPEIEGLHEHWGTAVLHCPYCHGWEVRDQTIGVVATSAASVHQALLFSQLTDQITLVTHSFEPDAESLSLLAGAGVDVLDGTVRSVESDGDAVSGLRLEDGSLLPVQAVVVSPYASARSSLLESLGIQAVAHPSGMGDAVEVDLMGQTSVPGVYAAGNVTDISAQVMGAAAAGTKAGAAVNADLVMTDAREKVVA
jgi:thioredoxin reductase